MLNLKVLSKKCEVEKDGKKRTFLTYFTPVKITVKGEEEKGLQRKTLSVKFVQECRIPEPKNFLLTVDLDKKQISIPNVYEIKVNDKGEKEYPTVWIRGYESYKELHRKPKDENTAFGVTFEADTEEIEINDSDSKDDLPF